MKRGDYHPDGLKPGTILPNSAIFMAFKSAGFRWGGQIIGQQKDIMHFSLTGD